MPTPEELRTASLAPGFDFTKGVPVLSIAALPGAKRVPMNDGLAFGDVGARLFDVLVEPAQQIPIDRPEIAHRLLQAAIVVLEDHDTPDEVYRWYGIDDIKTRIKEDHHETAT